MTLLTEAALRTALRARPFRFFEQIGSTNDEARGWALHEGAPSGALVISEEQTSGRGRFDRRWVAPPGGALLFSVILRPCLSAERIGRITMLGGLAVAESLDGLLPGRIALKWPNDVQIDGLKAAGMLAEAAWTGSQLSAIIFGIGLNVRIDFAGTPLEGKAISLETACGHTVDRIALLADILRRIDSWLPRLESEALHQAWRARLSTIGKRITASGPDGNVLSGTAQDVDTDGALLLITDDGAAHRIIAGEVTLAGE